MRKLYLVLLMLIIFIQNGRGQERQISLESVLENMCDVSDLPELADTKTAMSSTWDRNGGNNDDADFKQLAGRCNVLLDVDGPGVVSRIFTGTLSVPLNESVNLNRTRLQVFIDHQSEPVIDCPVRDFFTKNPFTAYPFVFGDERTYPGFLLPIPFSKHIKIQLWSLDEFPVFEHWGNYWQVTYTRYAPEVTVNSFALPLSPAEKQQMEKTGSCWIDAEKHTPLEPGEWERAIRLDLGDQKRGEYTLKGPGVIDALGVEVFPNTPEALKDVRFRIYWDGMPFPSVDVPLGYFFGNADYASEEIYSSLLMGINSTGGYCRFPMPFSKTARIVFSVPDASMVKNMTLNVNFTKNNMPPNEGYFHTTWTEQWATASAKRAGDLHGELNIPGMPKYGKRNIPVHIVMDRKGFKGKYVGMLLHVAWPNKNWWGEGDVLIWTDESGWPPSYHGTGTEEYFNSGWGDFDRKAISGYIKKVPGNALVYSFHIHDAFNFKNSIKIGVERWNVFSADNRQQCIWGSTAYWYAGFPLPAESRQQLLTPRLDDLNEPSGATWK